MKLRADVWRTLVGCLRDISFFHEAKKTPAIIPRRAVIPRYAINAIRRAGKQNYFFIAGGRDVNLQPVWMPLPNFTAHWKRANNVAQRGDAKKNHGFFPVARALENQPEREVKKINLVADFFPQRLQK